MYVDLSRLSEKGVKWAVHCPTKETAEAFVTAMRFQYPSHAESWRTTTRWENYKEKTCYCPDLNGAQGDNRLTYSELEFFMNPAYGFTVIEFDSLCFSEDELSDVDSSDIELLLLE